MYGRSSVNSVGGGGGNEGGGDRPGQRRGDIGSRAQSLLSTTSKSSIGGDSSSVETGPRSSRDAQRSSLSSANNSYCQSTSSSLSSVDGSRASNGSRRSSRSCQQSPLACYDPSVVKTRASVLSQLSSIFGEQKVVLPGANYGSRRSVQVWDLCGETPQNKKKTQKNLPARTNRIIKCEKFPRYAGF